MSRAADYEGEEAAAELPAAAYVVLGMLRLGARSGYDIKRAVERSTRFFWTISPVQIYPSLKSLESSGLVHGRAEPRGRRPRRVYELSEEGERMLGHWLRSGESTALELRDVGMLKLFFADALEPADARSHVRALKWRSEQAIDQMRRESEPVALALTQERGERFPQLVLRIGIAVHQAVADSCAELERDLWKGDRA